MPVYEYQCTACHKEFEYQQRMSDPDKTTCEVCGGSLERLISRTAFTLKGSGWYKDLYSSSKPAEAKKETTADAAPKTDSGTSTTTKTESAPAASPAPTTPNKGGGSSTSAAAAKVS
jgi:putative FmdB family regulatory protein